jgi:glycosyltransferase involved in cell wall biosynthesis
MIGRLLECYWVLEMKILLFIRSLGMGGAERQLLVLAEQLALRYDVTILTFYDLQGGLDVENARSSVRKQSLRKSGRWDIFPFLWRFLLEIRRTRPDVVYAFMTSSSLIALIAKLVRWETRVIWGVRSSDVRLAVYGNVAKALRWLECRLSRWADLIISNSFAGKREAISSGFRKSNFDVIPNGIDTGKFKFDPMHRRSLRESLQIPDDVFVIGSVARHDPMKGLEYLIRAASTMVKEERGEIIFLIVGSGCPEYTESLRDLACEVGIAEIIVWVPKTVEVASYYSVMDMFTSSSIFGEGFSNAIGEAMACGLPVVATNVGDASHIIGSCGRVVDAESSESLVNGWKEVMSQLNVREGALRAECRERIVKNFGIEAMVDATAKAISRVFTAGSSASGTIS